MEAMDFMNPRRRLRHTVMLAIGYVLVGIALLLISIILLFVAYGFGLKDGHVIQSGLLFVSSSPNPAQIYIDGSRYQSDTNARLVLPEATYQFVLKRSGYRDWHHTIAVDGGLVQSYAYPLLLPNNLTTNTVRKYAAAPASVSQSLDKRWLLVAQPASLGTYDLYDLNATKLAQTTITVPASLLTPTTEPQRIDVVAWADDNTRLLLKYTVGSVVEYLLFDRSAPDQSVNLSRSLTLPTADIELQLLNNHPDRYLVFNTASRQLSRAVLGTSGLQPLLTGVLAYTTTGDTDVLYATPDPLDPTKVAINIYDGSASYTVRRDAAGSTYLLALATYKGDMYVATSAASSNVAFVYKNPLRALTDQLLGVAVPKQVLRIASPTSATFSPDGHYIAFESGSAFAVYDAENDHGVNYTLPDALDPPQTQANWMDGAQLTYVSKGRVVMVDFDGQNRQTLSSADARYHLTFDQQNKYLYAFVPAAGDQASELLTATSLRTAADQ